MFSIDDLPPSTGYGHVPPLYAVKTLEKVNIIPGVNNQNMPPELDRACEPSCVAMLQSVALPFYLGLQPCSHRCGWCIAQYALCLIGISSSMALITRSCLGEGNQGGLSC